MRRLARALCAASCLALPLTAQAQRAAEPVPLRARILAAEDARPFPADAGTGTVPVSIERGRRRSLGDPLAPLYDGLTSLPELQIMAVRGLGRFERADLVPRIATLVNATTPAVRAEAANALAQAVTRGEAAPAFDRLQARIAIETDATVRGVLARSLGRLPYRTAAEVTAAQAAVLALLDPPSPGPRPPVPGPTPGTGPGSNAPAGGAGPAVPTVLGVASGLESLARRTATIAPLGDAARGRLARFTRFGLDGAGVELLLGAGRDDGRRVRRLAVSALTAAGGMDRMIVTASMADPDAQVRRLAVNAAGRLPLEPWTLDLLEKALFDVDPRVRIDALRQRVEAGGRVACQASRLAMGDDDPHVVLSAIDLAGRACAADVAAVQTLDDLATPPDSDPTSSRRAWRQSAHALVALARLMPDRTRARLAPFATHPVWQVRLYAARAAGVVGANAVLQTLARDANDNVCEAALTELARRIGRGADPLLLAALTRTDGQVVRTAARLLAGTTRRTEAIRALLTALARITVELRETSRDVRMALLDRLAETGAALPSTRDELAAYVTDFDPVVATRVATLLTTWRGAATAAQSRPLPRVPLPAIERLASWRDTTAVVTMASGGVWRLRLFPEEAPTNVARFVRMAATGWFTALTFHRVEPTFVIQGGSPHANEYAGDGPFTRDEVGLRSHLRGTIGISTRGRDTGDGQIFVNLVDNVRLDHNYTIIGEVIEGMEVVDRIVEGDVIERVVLERTSAARAGRP